MCFSFKGWIYLDGDSKIFVGQWLVLTRCFENIEKSVTHSLNGWESCEWQVAEMSKKDELGNRINGTYKPEVVINSITRYIWDGKEKRKSEISKHYGKWGLWVGQE